MMMMMMPRCCASPAALCCCSVQYMQQPERVFAEVYRVLKPGGVFILTFSNRMFYDKVRGNCSSWNLDLSASQPAAFLCMCDRSGCSCGVSTACNLQARRKSGRACM
jgi:SAM-dependent methyltransferase